MILHCTGVSSGTGCCGLQNCLTSRCDASDIDWDRIHRLIKDNGINLNIDIDKDGLSTLADRLGTEFPAITLARQSCAEHVQRLRSLFESAPSNTAIVAFGSLAREEWTSGSDVDWTLLVDGPTQMDHHNVTTEVASQLESNHYGKPGPTGTFGEMSSSHELVHHIGGVDDTNRNITRRILLLLESICLSDPITHERVVKSVLERYIIGDPPATTHGRFRAPLFLLNDVVRFWRTMTVDYAAKKWQRSNKGWALRNVKLRMSRKLLFAKGLLVCFLCHEDFSGRPNDPQFANEELLLKCFQICRVPAIQLLANVMDSFADPETAKKVLHSYDQFLATLNNEEKRGRLSQLEFGMTDDHLFVEQRDISRTFREGLEELFFESHDRLTELTRRYGVF